MIKYITAQTMWVPLPVRIHNKVAYLHLPGGYCSDGATGVPDICVSAFMVHDFIFANAGHVFLKFEDGTTDYVFIDIGKADLIYCKILAFSTSFFRRWLRYIGLRILRQNYPPKQAINIIDVSAINSPVQICPHYLLCCYHPNSQIDMIWWEEFRFYKV